MICHRNPPWRPALASTSTVSGTAPGAARASTAGPSIASRGKSNGSEGAASAHACTPLGFVIDGAWPPWVRSVAHLAGSVLRLLRLCLPGSHERVVARVRDDEAERGLAVLHVGLRVQAVQVPHPGHVQRGGQTHIRAAFAEPARRGSGEQLWH
eukprot:1182870-Prorocentrum_minimum.AAC.1